MRSLENRRSLAIIVAASLCATSVLSAGADTSTFPLIKAVPADVFIAVATKANPERKFLDDHWSRVSKAFWDAGIVEDIWDIVTDSVPDEELDQVEQLGEQFGELCTAVNWGELFGTEMVYAARFDMARMAKGSPYEGVFLCRLDKKKAKATHAALKAILEQVGKLAAEEAGEGEAQVKVEDCDVAGASMTLLTVKVGTEGPTMPIGGVGLKDDIVIVSIFGDALLPECLGRLGGSSKVEGLVEDPRFKAAMGALPKAEDSLVFWNVNQMMSSIGGMVKVAVAQSEGQPHAQVWVKLIAALIEELSIVDYSATVEWTEGYRVFSDTVTALRKNADQKPLCKIFSGRDGVKNFDRFIPEEAESFEVSSGIDWVALYRWGLGFAAEHVPDSEEALDTWATLQEDWELNVEKDVLSLLAGPMASYTLGDEGILLFEVTDEKKALAQVKRLLNAASKALMQWGGITMTPVEVLEEKGFLQLSNPMLSVMGGGFAPVVGCAEGHLILATSAATVETCLQTARGKHPRISRNARFKAEGLAPKSGPINSIHFADESRTAEEWREAIEGIGTGLGMVAMFAQGAEPEVQSLMAGLPVILGKLGPVVGKLDFYQSSAGYTSFDGRRWFSHKVQNYKPPKSIEKTSKRPEASGPDE